MQITALDKVNEGATVRVGARVTWEEADRAPIDLYVRVDARHGGPLRADPSAWLAASLIPAWRWGERRVRVEGELCPVLRDNIRSALLTLKHWYPADFGDLPEVEATAGFRARAPVMGGRSVCLMSCGVDSMATLRWNLLNLPREHPGSVGAAVMVVRERQPGVSADRLAARNRAYEGALAAVAADAEIAGVAVRTNLWDFSTNGYFYDEKWHGAFLAGVAGLFSGGYQGAYIAASDEPAGLHPWGCHPMLDPNYGSAHFRVAHHGTFMSRFAKTALVAGWSGGLRNLRVCQVDDQPTNCGGCEKCIRTMAALTALGKLRGAGSFPVEELTPALLATVGEYEMLSPTSVAYYRELIGPLRERGRDDLVAVVEGLVERFGRKGLGHARAE